MEDQRLQSNSGRTQQWPVVFIVRMKRTKPNKIVEEEEEEETLFDPKSANIQCITYQI